MFSSSHADNFLQAAFPYVSPCTRSFVVAALTVAHRVYALGDECDSVVATASNINLRWLKRCSVGIHVRNAADVEQIGNQVSSAHTVTFLNDNDNNASALGATYEAVARRFPHIRTLQCVALTKHTTPHVAHMANLTALELSSSVDKDCFQNLATTTTIQNTLSRLSFQDDITGFDHIMQCMAQLLPNVTDLQTDENVVTTPAGQDALLRVARRLTTTRGISSICNIFCASVANGMKWDAEPLKDIVLSTNAIPSSEDVENVVRQGLLYILDCSPLFNFDGSNDD